MPISYGAQFSAGLCEQVPTASFELLLYYYRLISSRVAKILCGHEAPLLSVFDLCFTRGLPELFLSHG